MVYRIEESELHRLKEISDDSPITHVVNNYTTKKYEGTITFLMSKEHGKQNELSVVIMGGKRYLVCHPETEHPTLLGEYFGTIKFSNTKKETEYAHLLKQ